jgi:hypothetical protein
MGAGWRSLDAGKSTVGISINFASARTAYRFGDAGVSLVRGCRVAITLIRRRFWRRLAQILQILLQLPFYPLNYTRLRTGFYFSSVTDIIAEL